MSFAETRSDQRIERLRHAAAFDQPGAEADESAIAGQCGNGLREPCRRLLHDRAFAHRADKTDPGSFVGDRSAQREALAQCRLALDALEPGISLEIGSRGNVNLLCP